VCSRVALVYNEPVASRYSDAGEQAAVVGVLDAVTAVNTSLLELGYIVDLIPIALPREKATEKLKSLQVSLVFNLFEGFPGFPETEALIPDVLSQMGIPCTGCSAEILRLALDKAKTKEILKAGGLATPRYQLLSPKTVSMFRLRYPCIVKPQKEDASHGLSEESLVKDFASLEKQVTRISNSYGGMAMVEEFLDGREFNATVFGNSDCIVLPISEITYSLPPGKPKILTFAAKWEPGSLYFEGTKAVCPAQISAEEQERITQTALVAFKLLGCQGYARVDMRLDKDNQLNILEINPNPDISPGTGAARQAEASGMTYTQFVEKIIKLALEKKQ